MTSTPLAPLLEPLGAALHEQRIVWLDHPENFRYVRETIVTSPFRTRPPRRSRVPGRLVAYAVLAPTARASWLSQLFERRCWYLAAHDPPEGASWPIEAVDPLTIRPGRLSWRPSTQGRERDDEA